MALCLLLKALGGSEKSRFATAGTRNDIPLHVKVTASDKAGRFLGHGVCV